MTPLYLNRAALAEALMIDLPMVGAFERSGVIPRPERTIRGEPSWNWGEVDRRLQSLPKQTTIYVIGFGRYVKIGRTEGPLKLRLSALQTGCPEQLLVYAELEGSTRDEKDLHRRFRGLKTAGEWFRREGELAAWIDAGCPLAESEEQ